MNPESLRTQEGAARLTCFYHGGCPDGIGGAWALFCQFPGAARAQLRELGGLHAGEKGDAASALRAGAPVFHGLAHGDGRPAAELVEGRDVVYVDIAPRLEILEWVAARARTLTILDHHRSSRAAIEAVAAAPGGEGRVAAVYDEARSGAQIAWDWAAGGAARPQVIDYIGDRDLYEFKLPRSRAVNKALYVEGVTRGFASLSAAADGGADGGAASGALAERGEAYARYEALLLARLAGNARTARVYSSHSTESGEPPREYCVLIVNSPLLQSELGEALMAAASAEVHFAVIWSYNHGRGEIWASARTNRPDVNLAVIVPGIIGASSGGGHPAAAGFTVAGDSIAAVATLLAPAPRGPA